MTRLLILFLLVPFLSFGQKLNSTELGGQSNLYNDAIKRYLVYQSKTNQLKLDTLTIEAQGPITDSLLAIIDKTRINVVNWEEIHSLLNKESSLILYKLFPLSFDKGRFFISIVPYSTITESNGVKLGYSGGCRIFYSFGSQAKQFKFVKVDCHGL
jgi:hypothetical protein